MEPSCHSRAATEVMGAERNAECGERSFPNALVDRTVAELLSILTNPKRTCETLVRGGTPIGCISCGQSAGIGIKVQADPVVPEERANDTNRSDAARHASRSRNRLHPQFRLHLPPRLYGRYGRGSWNSAPAQER